MNVLKLNFDNYIQLGLLLIAITSIISPVIVTILNNNHDYKIKQLERTESVKKELLSKFAKELVHIQNQNLNDSFLETLNLLCVYFSLGKYEKFYIYKINNSIYDSKEEFQNDMLELMTRLAKQI